MRLAISLGSNLGDRLFHLRSATLEIQAQLHLSDFPFLCSSIYETEPVDCAPNTPPFYNAVVECECELPPEQVLACLQKLEQAAGRPKEHAFHAPRILDLDVLYYGDIALDNADLTLPHPRLSERLFVLVPLAEIVPHKILPCCPQGVDEQVKTFATDNPLPKIGNLL